MKVDMKNIGPPHALFGADGIGFQGTSGWVTHQFFVPREVLEHLSGKQIDSRLQMRQRFNDVAERIAEAAGSLASSGGPAEPGSYIMLKRTDFH